MGASDTEVATLAGGCFWCLEAVFELVRGVRQVESGYTGGTLPSPSYEQVCGGRTGHAEAVRIHFDAAEVSYRDLLEVFFAIHDPTTTNRQGSDVGPQYRSAIFYHSDSQRAEAETIIAELTRQGIWPAPIVTELRAAPAFYPVEEYHRHYFATHPEQGYCQFVIAPKLAKFRAHLAAKAKR